MQVRDVLGSVGQLKALQLQTGPPGGQFTGSVFCEYASTELTEKGLHAIPGIQVSCTTLLAAASHSVCWAVLMLVSSCCLA